ncbi:hypothetical protein ACJ72_07830 [Emergomyces africanus]|uniref:Fungal calcium binding protein domain-containing protein n=1 Tax=Emergomyces africanus TaxID=1955775 RepID=A0A1B7NMF6_9EURO|nr:hypothetical protein ACJ72_07830 [Emergomyces africanus]
MHFSKVVGPVFALLCAVSAAPATPDLDPQDGSGVDPRVTQMLANFEAGLNKYGESLTSFISSDCNLACSSATCAAAVAELGLNPWADAACVANAATADVAACQGC